jgi:N-glycosylase/DNA lyase
VTSPAFVLPLSQAVDLTSTLASGQCFRWRPNSPTDLATWTGVIGQDLVRLRMAPGGLTIDSTPAPPAELAESIASYLRLDDDLPAIQARIGRDTHVREGIDSYPGLRLLRQDPWETLAGFILSSTSNIVRISRTMELLAGTYGQPLTLDAVTRNTFPGPDVLAEAGEQALRDLGCGFRAPYLAQAASAVASGELRLDSLRDASYDDVLAALTSLYGVADKIADCAMLFSLNRLDAFPADRWVRRVVVDLYGLPANVSYDGVRQWARERFGADAGYANQYLFWSIRQATRPKRLTPSG